MDQLLYEASKTGDLSQVTQYSAECWKQHGTGTYMCMYRACTNGHLEFVKWLCQTFKLTYCPPELFAQTLKNGHLHVAQWLYSNFMITYITDVLVDAFIAVCGNGQLTAAQWMYATFKLTAADARSNSNYALRWSCIMGHLDVAKWLQETFGLTAEDFVVHDNYAFRLTVSNGQFAVVRWLCNVFGQKYPTWSHKRADSFWPELTLAAASRLTPDILYDVRCRM